MVNRGLKEMIESQLQCRHIRYSQMARQLGVSHATVHRWLIGTDVPDAASCGKLAAWSGYPLHNILYMAGHIDVAPGQNGSELPAIRQYLTLKYPGKIPDELVAVLEAMIAQNQRAAIVN